MRARVGHRCARWPLALALALAGCKGQGGGEPSASAPAGRDAAAQPAAARDAAVAADARPPVAAGPLDGVWRVESLVDAGDGKAVGAGWTHRVFAGATARMVTPTDVVYDDDPGEDSAVVLDPSTDPPGIEVQIFRVPAKGGRFLAWGDRGTYRLDGDRLVITWRSTVETLVREPDAALAARLAAAPARVPRPTRVVPGLATFAWDGNLRWWSTKVELDAHGPSKLSFEGPAEPDAVFFTRARRLTAKLQRTAIEQARAHAADKLLALYNDTWREAGDPALDAAGFAAKLFIEGVTVFEDGSAEVFFYDSDMFAGHAVVVRLDAKLRPTDASISG